METCLLANGYTRLGQWLGLGFRLGKRGQPSPLTKRLQFGGLTRHTCELVLFKLGALEFYPDSQLVGRLRVPACSAISRMKHAPEHVSA